MQVGAAKLALPLATQIEWLNQLEKLSSSVKGSGESALPEALIRRRGYLQMQLKLRLLWKQPWLE